MNTNSSAITTIKNTFYQLVEEIKLIVLMIIYIIQDNILTKRAKKLLINLPKTVEYFPINNKMTDITIYRNNPFNSKRYLFFISGGFSLVNAFYIRKVINDLLEAHPLLNEKYNIIVLEKKTKHNLDLYDDITEYIRQKIPNDVKELSFFSFCIGGVTASHVLSKLKDINCPKKLILYDSIFNSIDNIKEYTKNYLYRVDCKFYSVHRKFYLKQYKHIQRRIKPFLKSKHNYANSSEACIELMKTVHNLNDTEIHKHAGFNFDQTPDTKIYNIYSNRDCVTYQHISRNLINQHKLDAIRNGTQPVNMFDIEKNTLGHCTDMTYSTKYLDLVLPILVCD